MQQLALRTCVAFLCVLFVGATVDPRGTRPVEQGTRNEKCASQQEWPFCTSDEWGPKCPSGCRIQGLMNKYDHDLLKKIEKIRGILDQNTQKERSSDILSKETYDYVKDRLVIDSGYTNNYHDLAQTLRQRIVSMKIKIDRQLRLLNALKERAKDQVAEMQRLEVDIDIKLRSCKGSCERYSEYQVDYESYVALDKQVNQLDSQSAQSIETAGSLFVMKSRPLRDVTVESIYKSGDTPAMAGQQTEDMFYEANLVNLVLEQEGSSMSPATVSKNPVCVRLEKQREGRSSQTRKKQHCPLESRAALCSDDDWKSKCPSGCRLQGALWQLEDKTDKNLRAMCKTAMAHEKTALKSMTLVTDIYKKNRQVLVKRHMSELNFVEQAQRLSRNLTSLQKYSSRMSQKLEAVHHQVLQQLEELYRTEVDISIKLQACTGSCQSASPLSVNHESYQDSMERLDKAFSNRLAAEAPTQQVPRLKLLPADLGLVPSAEYKTIPIVQRELLTEFEDIEPNQIILEDSVESDMLCSEC